MPRPSKKLVRPAHGLSDWKLAERVVALLEKTITPSARVRQNIWLPDLATGEKRQCDVLIEYGQPPRTTRALVEVQKRKERVKLLEFQGWCEKMRAIGAQTLICVSKQEFPKSVKQDVILKRGPTVRLVRLRELERGEWPIDLQGSLSIHIPVVHVDPARRVGALYSHKFPSCAFPEQIKISDPLFRTEDLKTVLSLKDVLDDLAKNQGAPLFLRPGTHNKTLRVRPQKRLWLHSDEEQFQIAELVIPLMFEVQEYKLPFVVSAYEQQVDETGTIAWLANATGTIDGNVARVTFTFVPRRDGRFEVRCAESVGIQGGGFLCGRLGVG